MRISLANPTIGGAHKVSLRRASSLLKRGLADWTPEGQLRINDQASATHERRQVSSIRSASDVYVEGEFKIAVIDRWTYPHTQWLHGASSTSGSGGDQE